MSRRPPPVNHEPVTPVPAATVVLVRPAGGSLEVLLTRRPSTMAFAAGLYVFPGGRVDPEDASTELAARSALSAIEAGARLGGDGDPAAALALHVAAVRELFEEAGVLLADSAGDAARVIAQADGAGPADTAAPLGPAAVLRADLLAGSIGFADVAGRLDLRLRTDLLVPIARWTTPAAYPRRFDARFFAAELPDGAGVSFVGDEVTDHRWTTAAAALDSMARREIEMWIPTSATLQRMATVRTFDELRRRLTTGRAGGITVERSAPDLVRIHAAGAGGAPGRPVTTVVVGRRDLAVIDPGDPSPAALATILEVVRSVGGTLGAICISSPDPDAAAGADELSERTGAVVFGGAGSQALLPFPVTELPAGGAVPGADAGLHIRYAGAGRVQFEDEAGRTHPA